MGGRLCHRNGKDLCSFTLKNGSKQKMVEFHRKCQIQVKLYLVQIICDDARCGHGIKL